MATPTTERTPTDVQATRTLSSWSSPLQAVVLVAALIALDLLPLYALLLVAAGYSAHDVSRVALPFSYLAVASVTFALIGRLLRRLPVVASILAGILAGLGLLVAAIAISPAAYGETLGGLFDGAWVSPLLSDIAASSPHINAILGLAALLLVLGFRGVALGRANPALESVLNLLKISVAAIVLAAILAAGLAPAARIQAEAALSFFLPLDVFAGLLASALSRAALNREELRGADPRTAGGERWLAMAIVLSGVVVVVTLIISSIVSFGSLTAALRQLGPVGAALDTLLDWVIQAFALLLYFLFGPLIAWLQHLASQSPPAPLPTPPGAPQEPPSAPPPHSIVSDQWVHVAQIALLVVGVLLLLVLAVAILRLLLGARRQRTDDGIAEEREALDGASLLQAQLRGLLDRFRRHPVGEAEEPLPPGSVRALYRELLRAAAARGIGRREPETPDEYGRRLGETLETTLGATPGATNTAADVTVLSNVYDAVRYGEREPSDADRRPLRERTDHVLKALRRRAESRR